MAKSKFAPRFIVLIFAFLLAAGIILMQVSESDVLNSTPNSEEVRKALYLTGLCLTVLFGILFGYSFAMVLNQGKKAEVF